ncbi:MAG: protein translocase subunit SecD [Alphaproteobacteria bacterium]|nr:protein translocase subunit SecD [Alphaproteobacteria bacterium]MDE2110339.1 protein translocase subunit SecD [Alphaproteobacteria bacterium]MDE2494878.1 protein translocase subunit SecD [Alphaproteobacteria bacterium]
MLQVSRWIQILVAIIVVGGILIALPNALPESVRTKLPAWGPHDTVSLGLDLQGGSYVLLEVELDQVMRDRLQSTVGDVRRALRKGHIGYTDLSGKDGAVSVRILETSQFADAVSALKDVNPSVGGTFTVGAREYDVTQPGNGQIVMRMSDAYKIQTETDIVNQSIEVVRRRIDELGTKEPDIEQAGKDRIVVQVPGLQDPTELINILQTTAKMTFQLVDETADVSQALRGNVPIGDELLYDVERDPKHPTPIVVERRIAIAGDRLTNAGWANNQQTGQVVVTMRFDSVGAREFADLSKNNIGRRFAIVLDNKIISAPVFREPILTGSGEIEGNFTVKSANDLAVLLRAGALPAPLKPIEMRSIGADLGADQIKSGRYSAIAGLILVAVFMILRYGFFGVIADIALTLNVILLLAALTLFGATLTLPGIAGIVLTMGMAVDANVLIYERMREEQHNGRSMLGSIDTGFRRAMATIIDANATHLIASLILFELGSGPVRGFAVTLGVGIITSFFTAVMVTRLMVIAWLNIRRPKKLVI